MQRVAPLRNSTVPDERRNQVRHRLTSILYVELGPGNGGIIVSLGTGGLSLHAAVKLNAAMELNLRFRLEPTEEPIEVEGRVAWLDPTQKEAGIVFKNLSSEAEGRIAGWIAAQEQAALVTQPDIIPQAKAPSMKSAEAPLSMRAPVPASLGAERFENGQPSVSERIPRRVLSESFLDDFSTTPSALQLTTSAPPALAVPSLEELFDKSSDRLLRLPARRYEAILEPEQPMPAAKEILPKDSSLPSSMPAATRVAEANCPAPQVNDSAASKLRRRRRLATAGAACAVGILALVTAAINIGKPSGRGGSGRRELLGAVSRAAGAESGRAPQTAAGPPSGENAQSDTSADDSMNTEAGYDLLPILPTNQPATVSQDGDWAAHVESMLGMDPPAKVNPAVLGLPVWTVQHSGFYYCGDDLNSETPQPGTLMTQGEALQSGYQPKLGSYCN
ncbi:MAG TPA: PilZ domain-containing protein [Candidatus Acidoferrales bacterium]